MPRGDSIFVNTRWFHWSIVLYCICICLQRGCKTRDPQYRHVHGEKWRSGEYERLLRIKNDYYKREESIWQHKTDSQTV